MPVMKSKSLPARNKIISNIAHNPISETAMSRRNSKRNRRPESRTQPAAPAYIRRNIPYYDLLSEEGLESIERHADQLLKEHGIEIRGDDETLRLFREAGAEVSDERVRFEPGLLKQIVASTPSEFVQHARDERFSVTIGGNNTVFVPAYGSPFIRNLDEGRRYGTIEDFRKLVQLTWMNPNLHHSGGTICEPVDLPVNKRHLEMIYAHMRYSAKPFLGSITSVDRAEDSIAMARILFGDQALDERCVIMGNINVNSPLVYDGTVTQVIRTYARAGQGIVICPFILGGAMGPVTPAAAVAQAHAEALVGVAIAQLEKPGAPAIYGNFLTTMSLRTGAPTFGQPEGSLAYLAVGQLARRNGIPLRCGGSFTSSKICDAQSSQESADSLMAALMAGTNFVLHSAGWLEGGLSMGYEKLILDADRLGMMAKMLRGLDLDDNAFAADAYHEAEFGSHFLGTAHTMANYQSAFYESSVADSNSFEQWREDGEKDAAQRANAIWKKQLNEYQPPPMDAAIDEALRQFVDQKVSTMPDAWY